MLEQEVGRAANFSLKAPPQTGDLKLVVNCCLNEFQLRFGMELQSHFFRRARRFANTLSPGTG